MFNRIIHNLFLTCKEATYLMEIKEANQLNFIQKIRLAIHLKICNYCKIYQVKKQMISELFKNEKFEQIDEVDEKSIDSLKTRIKNNPIN